MTAATTTGSWVVVRVARNFRVYNTLSGEYHRGTDKCVRVYAGKEAAQARADKLNERHPE